MNGFATEGTRAIGIALSLNKYLEHLDLSFNRVSNNAAADFARYFKINTTLKTVKVGRSYVLRVQSAEKFWSSRNIDIQSG